MNQVTELLNGMSPEEIALYSSDPSSEGLITIDETTRTISVPATLRKIAVQHDHNVETVTFDCPRYWDGIDMSTMIVYINYRRADGALGSYIADNVRVSDADDKRMNFDWIISRHITEVSGSIAFLVCIQKTDGEGNDIKHWNSELCKDMTISEGLECSDTVINEHPDVISQLLVRMSASEDVSNSVREDADNGKFTPVKGEDYYTETEKSELISSIFSTFKEMGALDIVKYFSADRVDLKPGKMYYFETWGDTYKARIYDQNGALFEEAMQGLIMLPQTGYCKYIGIKDSPSSLGLSDLFDFKNLFDKFIQTETFTPTSSIYLKADESFGCWEIAGNSRNLQVGRYSVKDLVAGITSELRVSFLYPMDIDEYAVAIDDVEVDRESYGGTIRIASELINATGTQIVFYSNGEEVVRATVQPTIPKCGVLYAIER